VLTQSNSFKLTGALGRRPNDAELYMAHFMGVGGASKLISSAEESPNASAPAMFPAAASANRSIFYNRDGSARSVSQVYSVLSSRYDSAANSTTTRSVLASMGVSSATSQVAQARAMPADNAPYLSQFPQVKQEAAPPQQVASLQQNGGPMFRSLFQAGDRAEPVSPGVKELWGGGTPLTATAQPNAPQVRPPRPLDLFSDPTGTYSS
jgi:hypothetical protein